MKKTESSIILAPIAAIFITATLSNDEFLSPMYIIKSVIILSLLVVTLVSITRKVRRK